MYRIVIADDEQLEREALGQALERFLGDEGMIEVAENGRAALESVRRLHADIAIMDIEMPGMTGLEASRAIREEEPNCRVVFLTAYGEFDYARQAVEMGAVDYLLKPCADEELYRVVGKLIRAIEERRADERLRELSTQRIENLTQWVEEQLVLTIMGGYLRQEWVQGQLEELGIGFCNGAFSILTSPDGLPPERIREILKGRVWPDWMHLITYEYDGRLYVLALSACSRSAIERMCECYYELSGKLISISQKRLYAAVGSRFDDLRDAQSSFFQAQTALARCGEGQFVVRYGEEDPDVPAETGGLSGAVCHYMLEGDAAQAETAMHMALEGLCAQQLDFDTILEKMERRARRVLQRLQEETGVDYTKRYDPHELLAQALDVDAVRAAVDGLLRELTAEVSGSRGCRMTQIMQEIEDYMRENYRRDIFLQQVAREMNYSDAYFSKLFKQCFNKNFVTYLTEARIEAAKDLLHKPTVNIKEVGAQVGYKDSNYFTKVFRRATGKSPSEYRISVIGTNGAQENSPS